MFPQNHEEYLRCKKEKKRGNALDFNEADWETDSDDVENRNPNNQNKTRRIKPHVYQKFYNLGLLKANVNESIDP